MVDRIWEERESILIWDCPMNRLPMLSPQIPMLCNNPPMVPVRVEMMPVDLITWRTTAALKSDMKTLFPSDETHTPLGSRKEAEEA
jgi:hypothetical protein